MYVCTCIYMRVYVCMFVYVYVCLCGVYMHVCMCVCICMYVTVCSDVMRERNVLFNDALNTFYPRLYGVRDHSDSEKGNPLPPHRLLLLINSKGSFICTIPQTG